METHIELVNHFRLEGTPVSVAPLGAGLINASYLVKTKEADKPDYLLQRINHGIFKNVELLQHNILHVTNHIRKKLAEKGETDIERKTLTIIPAKDGKLFYFDGEHYWRVYLFISGGKGYDTITPELAYEAGKAFGEFQGYLADIPEKIEETIPNFHNMEFRLEQFREAVANDAAGRVAAFQNIIQEIESRAEEMCKAERMGREGILPKRINHCDTKVNNVLFGEDGRILCVVDLDTVMPGYVLSDFGDFIRTGANTGTEDDADLNHVGVNLAIFEGYAKGYLETARKFLLPVEIENLPFGARLLTYMQTVRFFTDYLNGDTYYKINFPEHNLQRTKAQLKLLQDLEKNQEKMQAIIQSFL
ncbi:MAG: N-acetylhexosamine 1-kinase [Candidatus Ordinivivax streblomastigis]|uniref:N-acetylhexosamine 1-kinase n=1 Tax=Candidatus Ordinivivax streblomastigis TaxID=2540710 RepID=A0A5M8P0M0_9BACT|nr:MAG: N-acetylhexosamine 1-kinase [Candidatus Ordinivivax streblomastigis]